jgi:hypothetical protein
MARGASTHYRGAVDVKHAANLYAQGRSQRQIGAELGVSSTTVSEQLRRVGVTMRRGGPPAHPASTQQMLELRDQGLTWNEVAEKVDMTVSGAWSRYRKARPPKPPRLAVGSGFWPTPSNRTLRLASVQPSPITLGEPLPDPNSLLRGERRTVTPPSVMPACYTYQARMRTTMQVIATIWCWRSRM